MNKFFLIFLSASISRLLSGMEIVPNELSQAEWVSYLKENRAVLYRYNDESVLSVSCSKGGLLYKMYGGAPVVLLHERCKGNCNECDAIVSTLLQPSKHSLLDFPPQSMTPAEIQITQFVKNLEKYSFSEKQKVWLCEKISNGSYRVSKTARLVRCFPNSGDKSCCVIKDGNTVLVPCEVHSKKEPKRRVAGFSWVSCARTLLKPSAFAAGLYVASRIPVESWIGYCKSLFSR